MSDEPKKTARWSLATCHWSLFSWSGRRESNPRPTAWKAVTLPLSYSRILNCREQRQITGDEQDPPVPLVLLATYHLSLVTVLLVDRGGFEPPQTTWVGRFTVCCF